MVSDFGADRGTEFQPIASARRTRAFETFAAHAPAHPPQPGLLDRLTSREREVFDLLVKGHTNAEIARTLVIAETTAKTHVNHALDKLGLRDRVHAVVFAYENHLVTHE